MRTVGLWKNITQVNTQSRGSVGHLTGYSLIALSTYPRNETLVHQQLFLHQLHNPHPSQRLQNRFPRLRDVTRSMCLRTKSLLCVLNTLPHFGADDARVIRE